MPVTPPFPFKSAPDPVVAPLAPVTVIRQPVFTIEFFPVLGVECQEASICWDQMPVMNREPMAIPDVPGSGHSYDGCCLEYLDMGVGTGNDIPPLWSGKGAFNWNLYVDGIQVNIGSIIGQDGEVGPFCIGVDSFLFPFNWKAPHNVWLEATYHDRPSYNDFYIDPTTVGIGAFGPSQADCPCFACPSARWGDAGYWDPWVSDHHAVGDVLGPKDRNGNYLGLTGPWGSAVPQQHLETDPTIDLCHTIGVQDGSAFFSSLIDIVSAELYPEVSYLVQSAPWSSDRCKPSAYPILRHRHKVAPGDGGEPASTGDATRLHFQQTQGFKAS